MIHETSQNGVCILEGSGRLDFHKRKEFQKSIKQSLESGSQHIVFNLKVLTYIDSAGLGLLLLAAKECQQSNVRFSLCKPEDYVKDVLDLANMESQIPIFETLEKALSYKPQNNSISPTI